MNGNTSRTESTTPSVIDSKNEIKSYAETTADKIKQGSSTIDNRRNENTPATTNCSTKSQTNKKTVQSGTFNKRWHYQTSRIAPSSHTRVITKIGRGVNQYLAGSVKTVPRLGYLHVYRLDPNTSVDDFKNDLLSAAPNISFEKTEHSGLMIVFFNPAIWPNGCLLTAVNCLSVRWAMRIQSIFTASKLFALVVIILAGMYHIAAGNTENFSNAFDGNYEITEIALSFYSGLFAFGGWNFLNFVTEELQDPYRLREVKLTVSFGKCHFCRPELKYLGHDIDKNGLHVDPEKVQSMLQLPAPKTVKENLKDPTGRLVRWAVRLQQYNFKIVHRKGEDHVVPDTLSRFVPY
ncbi:hypothetical protein JTB14_011923 [Gonioctena quinquepunctata]|nr:hypothetical protein JTB14_011923 [Gonioctena quinquepunctata]